MKRTYAMPLGLIGSTLLLVALLPLPYGYYTFLRWSVTLIAVILIVIAVRSGRSAWSGILVPIAILWNPIVPVFLARETWMALDLLGAIVLALVGVVLARRERRSALV